MTRHREFELAELLAEVRRIEVQAKRLVASVMAGGYESVFRGSGIEFDEVREYVEGDDPRTVDWNVTARVGRPFVKTFVDERELTVLFLVDLSASMSAGFGHWSPRQMAARVCACMALSAVANNDRVGMIAFSDAVDEYVPARKGRGHALRVVRDCLGLRGSSAASDLAPALRFAGRAVRRHAILFVLSDFLSRGWREAMSVCAKRHDVIAVRIGSPELDAIGPGMERLVDPESGRVVLVDWRSRRTRRAYRARVDAWRTATERDLRRAGVDLMDVPIPTVKDPDAVARPILRFFRMRDARGAKR